MNTAPTSTDVRRHILDVAHPLFLSRGFTAVGLTEVLAAAKVPKGSFYHYFPSKEAFGQAVLDAYFASYLERTNGLLTQPGTAQQRLMAYFVDWLESQTGDEAQSRCLVVKLGAEVSDLSDAMRSALERGTRAITARLARCIEEGGGDGSLPKSLDATSTAMTLYQNWLGASLLAKITRDRTPLDTAMKCTRQMLGNV